MSSEHESLLDDLKFDIIENFLKGGARRFSQISPETLSMIDYLNHKQRDIEVIEKELEANDALSLKVTDIMASRNLLLSENIELDLSVLGLENTGYKNYLEICNHGNSLYVELVITQFAYYVDKLGRLGYKNFDDFLQSRLEK